MIAVKNSVTGVIMMVADERAEEYVAAGHCLVAPAQSDDKPVDEKKPRKKKVK